MSWNVPYVVSIDLKLSQMVPMFIYSPNNPLKGILLRGNWLSPSLPDALNAAWATAGRGARGAWWEMEALLPAAVLEHKTVVWFPRALIREPPLTKSQLPAANETLPRNPHRSRLHTTPPPTLTRSLTVLKHTHLQSCELFLLRVQPPGANLVRK